jgi:hypothetical protein
MPNWIIQLAISIAIKLGPYALRALLPKVPEWAQLIIKELINAIEGASGQISTAKEIKRNAVLRAKRAIKERRGVGSAPEIKKEI